MGSFQVSKPDGLDILSAADTMSPGTVVQAKKIKAMPGDVPKTTPIAMVKPFKQKVIKVPNKKMVVAKSFDTKERKNLSKKGKAKPDGSFPIRNKKDLSNAKRDLGRAGNKASDRAWINKRAKQLGAPKLGAASCMMLLNKYDELDRKAKMNAGGPGSGRTPYSEGDSKTMHEALKERGYKHVISTKLGDGSISHHYAHPDKTEYHFVSEKPVGKGVANSKELIHAGKKK